MQAHRLCYMAQDDELLTIRVQRLMAQVESAAHAQAQPPAPAAGAGAGAAPAKAAAAAPAAKQMDQADRVIGETISRLFAGH